MEKLNLVTIETETKNGGLSDLRFRLTINLDTHKLLSIHSVSHSDNDDKRELHLLLSEEELEELKWIDKEGVLLDYKHFLLNYYNRKVFGNIKTILRKAFGSLNLLNWELLIFEIYEALAKTYWSN